MSKVADVKRVKVMVLLKSKCIFCPMSMFPVKFARENGITVKRLKSTTKGRQLQTYLIWPSMKRLIFWGISRRSGEKLETLSDVGLGYIHLGQRATTLSGGEAQRVKLSTELSKIGTGNTIYILDEPTTGLHFEDIKQLLTVLSRLVEKGNTAIVIEHNMDVIKTADYIIDLGPEGGDNGDRLLHPVYRSQSRTFGSRIQGNISKKNWRMFLPTLHPLIRGLIFSQSQNPLIKESS